MAFRRSACVASQQPRTVLWPYAFPRANTRDAYTELADYIEYTAPGRTEAPQKGRKSHPTFLGERSLLARGILQTPIISIA